MSPITPIQGAAVLGAGTMGAQIAAHLANAGLRVLLLDQTPAMARDGLKRATALRPDPFFTKAVSGLLTLGGLDDLSGLAPVDWVIEAVVERADVKRALLARVDEVRRPGTLISSNTSGIPLATLAAGRTDDFRRHFVGTHFFNPPRYLRLLELIPTADTNPTVVDRLTWFADHRLGKGVVIAKDTPNFIANHIGLFGVMKILEALTAGGFTIEEVDAITGTAMGRPKSATFRTMDVAGIDVLAHVISNLAERLPEDDARRAFYLPPVVAGLIERGWLGEKSGQGFYKRVTSAGAAPDILTLDPATMAYRPRQAPRLAALEAVQAVDEVGERIKTLFLGKDRVGEFLRATLGPTLVYTARVTPQIAHSIDDVDRVMRWGFGWQLGPFETWDAIGIQAVLDAVGVASPPPLVASVQRAGADRFRSGRLPPAAPDLQILRSAKDRLKVVRTSGVASLVDLGDGVLAVEFHSKMNAIGTDTMQMLQAGLTEATTNFAALVVGNDADNFSAGANLMLLLLEAQDGNWDEIDLAVRTFQGVTQALRYAPIPVIIATAGLALGGGCEIVLHGDRSQAAAESYIGLTEVSVGLIPGGGGTKEMLARAVESAPDSGDLLHLVQPVFETIGFGKVSTSAADAHRLGYLREADGLTMNRDRLMFDAKALALARAREGYHPPSPRTAIAVGGETVLSALKLGVHLAWRAGRITDHDAVVGRTLARVLAGGALPHRTTVSEAHLLDLEREAFLQLCGERRTHERIQHTLKTGKPLRN